MSHYLYCRVWEITRAPRRGKLVSEVDVPPRALVCAEAQVSTGPAAVKRRETFHPQPGQLGCPRCPRVQSLLCFRIFRKRPIFSCLNKG